MSDILRFRIIGLCILAAFPLFGVGQALLGSEWHWLGLLMCLSNSVAVIIIGFLMRPIIATTAPRSGDVYFIARIAEGFLLGISVVALQGRFFWIDYLRRRLLPTRYDSTRPRQLTCVPLVDQVKIHSHDARSVGFRGVHMSHRRDDCIDIRFGDSVDGTAASRCCIRGHVRPHSCTAWSGDVVASNGTLARSARKPAFRALCERRYH